MKNRICTQTNHSTTLIGKCRRPLCRDQRAGRFRFLNYSFHLHTNCLQPHIWCQMSPEAPAPSTSCSSSSLNDSSSSTASSITAGVLVFFTDWLRVRELIGRGASESESYLLPSSRDPRNVRHKKIITWQGRLLRVGVVSVPASTISICVATASMRGGTLSLCVLNRYTHH